MTILGDKYEPLTGLSSSAGLVSCVTDLAKFDAALDRNTLISSASKELMLTPTVSNSGQTLPYALGWFVQKEDATRIVWHYGLHPPSISSLYIKLPEKQLSFILLANTDRLSANVPLGDGNVRVSPFARAFLSIIAFPEE
jgi:CubicO group peptidase (beta-lactamase class C family)